MMNVRTAPEEVGKGGTGRENPLLSSASHLPPDRMRLLRSLFGRACQTLRDRLFEVAGVPFEATLEDLHLADVAHAGVTGAEWLVALCSVRRHNNLSCIALDAGAVNLVMESFLGGGAEGRTVPQERQWTSFDHLMTGHAAEVVIDAMSEAFAPTVNLEMTLDEVRTADTARELALEERPVLAARIALQALGESGTAIVILPPGLFGGLRACAMEGAAETATEDGRSPWAEVLDSRLKASEVVCRAVMDGGEITLGEVARLRPGQILELDTRKQAPVRLECDGETLFHCELGQAAGAFTLRLLEPADREGEFLESITGMKGRHGNE